MAELAERSPIIIQNGSSDPSTRKNLDLRPYDRPHKVLLLTCVVNFIAGTALSSSPVVSALGSESDGVSCTPDGRFSCPARRPCSTVQWVCSEESQSQFPFTPSSAELTSSCKTLTRCRSVNLKKLRHATHLPQLHFSRNTSAKLRHWCLFTPNCTRNHFITYSYLC